MRGYNLRDDLDTLEEDRIMENVPAFEKDAHGYLLPGPVVRYYRERMTYTDTNGKVKRWTQDDVARQLGLTRLAVQNMENKNMGLDSIERRRTLAALLNIPLALLGLTSLEEHEKFMQSERESVLQAEFLDKSEIQLYQQALDIFKGKSDQGKLHPHIIETWISRITHTIKNGAASDDMLTVLANYHILVSKLYYNDLYDFKAGSEHLRTAKELAHTLHDNELLALSSHYVGELYLTKDRPQMTVNELKPLLDLNTQITGYILTDFVLASVLANTESNTLVPLKLLDKAERYIRPNDDVSLIQFDTVQYLECKADVLIALNKYKLALECIDETDDYIDTRPNIARNSEYLKIIRAECYIKQKKPEYDEALTLLSQVLSNNKNIQYYVNYVARLHKLIAASSYGNAPDVVHLGMLLRQIQTKSQE